MRNPTNVLFQPALIDHSVVMQMVASVTNNRAENEEDVK